MSSCPTQRSWCESEVWGHDLTPVSGALIPHQGLGPDLTLGSGALIPPQGLGPEQRDESLLPMPRVMV